MTAASNLPEFSLSLDRFLGQQLPTLAVLAHKKVTLEALRGVVKKSPVDTGRFRGNWQVSHGAPASAITSNVDRSPRGAEPRADTLTQADASLAGLLPYSVSFVQNNLPYAERLENGWSKQAPTGMVALTIAELQNQILTERDLGPGR